MNKRKRGRMLRLEILQIYCKLFWHHTKYCKETKTDNKGIGFYLYFFS